MKIYNWTNKIVICNRIAYPIDEFIDMCIEHWTIGKLSKTLGCDPKTTRRAVKKYIPEIEPSTASIGSRVYAVMGLKRCGKCKEIQPFDRFYSAEKGLAKIQSKCKCCNSKDTKAYRKTDRGRGLLNSAQARRRAAKLQRTPSWSNEGVLDAIYLNCPEGYHVDHIIPLQGELVSGLHVETNLQYLTATENHSKSNKFEV